MCVSTLFAGKFNDNIRTYTYDVEWEQKVPVVSTCPKMAEMLFVGMLATLLLLLF